MEWGGSERRCEDKALTPWVEEEKEPAVQAKKKIQKDGRTNKRRGVPESGEKTLKGK